MENITALEEEYNIINEEDIDDYIPEYIPDYKNDNPSQEDHEQEEYEPIETIKSGELFFYNFKHLIMPKCFVHLRNYVDKNGVRWFNSNDIYYMLGKKNPMSVYRTVSRENYRSFYVRVPKTDELVIDIFLNMKGVMEVINTARSDIRLKHLLLMIDKFHTPYVKNRRHKERKK